MNYKMKKMYGGTKKKMMQKGGAKPDYLDMDKDGNKTESMKSAVASKKQLGGSKEMKDLKASQKEMRKGMRMARKEQRGQEREERKDDRKIKRATKKGAKPASGKVGKRAASGKVKKMMGGSKMMKYQAGGFLEPPVYDLDA